MKITTMFVLVLFAIQFDAASANTIATRLNSWLSPQHEVFRRVAQGGNPKKIQQVIARASKYGTTGI